MTSQVQSSPSIISFLFSLLVAFAVFFFIFLIMRQFTLWYFKVNQIIGLLEKIEENTRQGGTARFNNEVSSMANNYNDVSQINK